MDEKSFKTCRSCYTEIDSRAKICLHCRSYQGKLVFLRHPASALIFVIPLMVPVVVFMFAAFNKFRRGEDFAVYRDQIKVLQSEIKFGEYDGRPSVVVIGTVNNTSNVDWEDIHFEVKFFDHQDKLADVMNERVFRIAVSANDHSTFKVSSYREFPEDKYVSHKIRVTCAKEKNTF